jgi:hypothetical protein
MEVQDDVADHAAIVGDETIDRGSPFDVEGWDIRLDRREGA